MNLQSTASTAAEAAQYPPAVTRLLGDARLNELGPGSPNRAVRELLNQLGPGDLCAGREVVDADLARACVAGLWLYHDFLDESHRLSQDIESSSGSFWHGIMHRREPDYGNAKYWFRRVGGHSVYERLLAAARHVSQLDATAASDAGMRRLLDGRAWDASAFVDLCQAAVGARRSIEMLCRQIQDCEWRLLFDDCYRKAIGAPRTNA